MIVRKRNVKKCKVYEKDHLCYMKPYTEANESNSRQLHFYDFETREDETGETIPFYGIIQRVRTKCDKHPFEVNDEEENRDGSDIEFVDFKVKKSKDCACRYRQFVFDSNGANNIPDFVCFPLKQKDSVWIAHNKSRFDTIFLLQNIMQSKYLVPDVIMNGNKVMRMHIPFLNATFLDSYLFLSMALSKFPNCLGFSDMTKGYHPYYFTDLSYRGKIVN